MPEPACLTCQKWASNYMTVYEMGHCQHDPAWTSRPHNGHCAKHTPADNIARRLAWLESKRGVVGTTAQAWGVK